MEVFSVIEHEGIALVIADTTEDELQVIESFGAGYAPHRARAEADALAAMLNAVSAAAPSVLIRYV